MPRTWLQHALTDARRWRFVAIVELAIILAISVIVRIYSARILEACGR